MLPTPVPKPACGLLSGLWARFDRASIRSTTRIARNMKRHSDLAMPLSQNAGLPTCRDRPMHLAAAEGAARKRWIDIGRHADPPVTRISASHHSDIMSKGVQWWNPVLPRRRLFELGSQRKQKRFCAEGRCKLRSDRQTFPVPVQGHRHGRLPGGVEQRGKR